MEISDKEKLENYRDKLDSMVISQEAQYGAISELVITDKLINDENISHQDLDSLVGMGKKLKLQSTQSDITSATRNMRETETVTNIKIQDVSSKLRKLSDKQECKNELSVTIVPNQNEFPHVQVNIAMLTRVDMKKESLPTIKKMNIQLVGLEVDTELEKAINYCQDKRDPQLVTKLVKHFLPLKVAKQEILENLDSRYFKPKSAKQIIEISNNCETVLGES